ncbi:hypothetical protein DEU56DRAFT_453208 [Suillus clintonianus]|uniref:uncharacterized protein n=1 Tax=Suillus clintonianus TaxID=1904413 RepID=UPI001B85D704|nr:uncharacterized protein DEU56DRAFT_453208 [Suillus clintonianus]KAG2131643.1 hypothetical protein DEU56DRAFT_453208 [Suillus clintonianus]
MMKPKKKGVRGKMPPSADGVGSEMAQRGWEAQTCERRLFLLAASEVVPWELKSGMLMSRSLVMGVGVMVWHEHGRMAQKSSAWAKAANFDLRMTRKCTYRAVVEVFALHVIDGFRDLHFSRHWEPIYFGMVTGHHILLKLEQERPSPLLATSWRGVHQTMSLMF